MDSMELNSNVVGCDGGCTAIVDTGRRYLYQGFQKQMGIIKYLRQNFN